MLTQLLFFVLGLFIYFLIGQIVFVVFSLIENIFPGSLCFALDVKATKEEIWWISTLFWPIVTLMRIGAMMLMGFVLFCFFFLEPKILLPIRNFMIKITTAKDKNQSETQ